MKRRQAGFLLVLTLAALAAAPAFAGTTADSAVSFTVDVPVLNLTAQPIPFRAVPPASAVTVTPDGSTAVNSFIGTSGANVAALTVQADATDLIGWTMGGSPIGNWADPRYPDQVQISISLQLPGSNPPRYFWKAVMASSDPRGAFTTDVAAIPPIPPGNYGGIAQLGVGPVGRAAVNQQQTLILHWTATAE